MTTETTKVDKSVNPHFYDFLFDWNQKFQFLVGGYGSSKSYHVGLKLLLKLTQEKRTALVVRNVYGTIKDSCYTLLKEIAIDLGLERVLKFTASPLEIRFPNGSKIIFRGMDDPAKLKSIHDVSLIWIEECSEIPYEGYKELVGRLRHPSLKLHMILSTNPIGIDNWSYKHFFKNEEKERVVLDDEELYKKRTVVVKDSYYHHSIADDNLFLPKEYVKELEQMKEYDPDLYRIAREGRFGVKGTKVLPQFKTAPHDEVMVEVNKIPRDMKRVGMDFGFETSYNALLRVAIDHENKILYIYYEYYKNKMTDDKTAEEISGFKETRELIRADSAEPKTIQYYKQQGFNMIGAKKFQGSKLQNTKKVKRFKKIICSEDCKNTIRELKHLTYKENALGLIIEDEFAIDPHTFSAIWYALDGYEVSDLKGAMVSGSAVMADIDLLEDDSFYDDYY